MVISVHKHLSYLVLNVIVVDSSWDFSLILNSHVLLNTILLGAPYSFYHHIRFAAYFVKNSSILFIKPRIQCLSWIVIGQIIKARTIFNSVMLLQLPAKFDTCLEQARHLASCDLSPATDQLSSTIKLESRESFRATHDAPRGQLMSMFFYKILYRKNAETVTFEAYMSLVGSLVKVQIPICQPPIF